MVLHTTCLLILKFFPDLLDLPGGIFIIAGLCKGFDRGIPVAGRLKSFSFGIPVFRCFYRLGRFR